METPISAFSRDGFQFGANVRFQFGTVVAFWRERAFGGAMRWEMDGRCIYTRQFDSGAQFQLGWEMDFSLPTHAFGAETLEKAAIEIMEMGYPFKKRVSLKD